MFASGDSEVSLKALIGRRQGRECGLPTKPKFGHFASREDFLSSLTMARAIPPH